MNQARPAATRFERAERIRRKYRHGSITRDHGLLHLRQIYTSVTMAPAGWGRLLDGRREV